ncbi:MAG: hypothetical protein ABR985_08640 [Methanotrichaceae archaeon]|jgi:hypothetical protein
MLTTNGNEPSTTFTKTERSKAEWIAYVYKESGKGKTSARALHYFCLGRTDYPVFNKAGQTGVRAYTDADDGNVTKWIALAKRLGLIDWDNLPDETVSESGVLEFYPSKSDFSYSYSLDSFNTYDLKSQLKKTRFGRYFTGVARDQPYHLELWCEKSTMSNILQPVCRSFGAVLVTFKGRGSWGGVWKLCKRVAQDRRPALIFYLSDLDASGFNMAAEVAAKIDEINRNFFDGRLDIRVRRIGLKPEQVVEHQIPLVPRKDTEKSNNGLYKAYVGAYGLNQDMKAELDALERYYPGGVAAFASSWLEKFFDSTLSSCCQEATTDFLCELPDTPKLPAEIIALRSKLLVTLEELIQAEQQIKVPVGGSERADIEPLTEDPAQISWLLSTKDGVHPSPGDVDFVVATKELV